MKNQLLEINHHGLGIENIEWIYTALTLFADTIWIHQDFTFSNIVPEQEGAVLLSKIFELREAGLIRFYRHEHEKDKVKTEAVLLGKYFEDLDDYFVDNILPLQSKIPSLGIENASKLIEAKRDFFWIWTLDLLDADGLLNPIFMSPLFRNDISNRNNTLKQLYSFELLRKTACVSPINLNTEDLIKLKKIAAPVSQQLSNMVQFYDISSSLDNIKMQQIKYDIDHMLSQYHETISELLSEHANPKTIFNIGKDVFIAIAGYFSPFISAIPPLERLYKYQENKQRINIARFIHEVRRNTSVIRMGEKSD